MNLGRCLVVQTKLFYTVFYLVRRKTSSFSEESEESEESCAEAMFNRNTK
ncbi:TPA: hypothetical protein ACKRZV_001367 [Proteus mirabilis]|nr:hypothetical protein [Proteus mirabilis]